MSVLWTDGKTSVPRPFADTQLSFERREIHACILVIGSDAHARLEAFQRAHSKEAASLLELAAAGPGCPACSYLPLTLGEIRGFTPHFHLYVLAPDQRVSDVEDFALNVGALVVAQASERDAGNVPRAARAIAANQRDVPVAVLGDDQAAAEWATLAGTPAISHAPSGDADFAAALKTVSRVILTKLKDS